MSGGQLKSLSIAELDGELDAREVVPFAIASTALAELSRLSAADGARELPDDVPGRLDAARGQDGPVAA